MVQADLRAERLALCVAEVEKGRYGDGLRAYQAKASAIF